MAASVFFWDLGIALPNGTNSPGPPAGAVLFLAGQSTGPAGAPFNDPALTVATNANNKAITNFMIILCFVYFNI